MAMEERDWHRPYVPPGTLERRFPQPLCSDQLVTLRGPRDSLVPWQALRWAPPAMGRLERGRLWPTALDPDGATWDGDTGGRRLQCWQQSQAGREWLPPAAAQHLREGAWGDPAGQRPRGARGGPSVWWQRPGRELGAARAWSPEGPRDRPGLVPGLCGCRPPCDARDAASAWSGPRPRPPAPQ